MLCGVTGGVWPQTVWVCSVLALLVALAVDPVLSAGHWLVTRSASDGFLDVQCRGVYDRSIFAKLERICFDCYNLFKEPEVHRLCREDCFTSMIFKGCVDTLQMSDRIPEIQSWIKQLHGQLSGF